MLIEEKFRKKEIPIHSFLRKGILKWIRSVDMDGVIIFLMKIIKHIVLIDRL
jgi:hypothetical protein